jgi:hypothetical protein
MYYLEIRFRPDRPGLRLATESDDVVAQAVALDHSPGRLARDVVYDWLIGADGRVLGVALAVSPGDGVLEAAPYLTVLAGLVHRPARREPAAGPGLGGSVPDPSGRAAGGSPGDRALDPPRRTRRFDPALPNNRFRRTRRCSRPAGH